MKNTYLGKNTMNEITQFIADNPETVVRLRNGNVVIGPVIFLGEDDWEDNFNKPNGFQDGNWNYCWNLDGSSVTNSDFDMVEIV